MAKKKKDWGENSKAAEVRSRKAAAKAQEREATSRRQADEYWAAAGDGARTKSQQKREHAEQKRQEAVKRREEARRLAAEEEASMASTSKKGTSKVAGPKVTHHELRLQQEAQRKADEQAVEARQKAAKNMTDAEDYARLVDVENTNRDEDIIQASTVEQALAALDVSEEKADRHPERRRKAAYLAFEERELAQLQQEKPGLKHSQYKDMIFKMWQKSPENPMNAIGTATK